MLTAAVHGRTWGAMPAKQQRSDVCVRSPASPHSAPRSHLLGLLRVAPQAREGELSAITRKVAERQDDLMWREFRERLHYNLGLVRGWLQLRLAACVNTLTPRMHARPCLRA